jgi:hypothetical protein
MTPTPPTTAAPRATAPFATTTLALALALALLAPALARAAPPSTRTATAPATTPSTAPSTAPASRPAPALLRGAVWAFGSADQYWIGVTFPVKEAGGAKFNTVVRAQSLPAGDWRELGVVVGRAVGVAECDRDLALLLDDGGWKRVGAGGLATGPDLPGNGPVLAWSTVGSTLYAVRSHEGGMAAMPHRAPGPRADRRSLHAASAPSAGEPSPASAAVPTTTRAAPPAAAATKPIASTKPAKAATPASTTTTTTKTVSSARPPVPVLLKFDKGEWVAVADVPPEAHFAGEFALAGAPGKPLLAAFTDPGPIRVWALSESADGGSPSHWADFGTIRPPAAASTGSRGAPLIRFDLLTVGAAYLPTLWTEDAAGRMRVFTRREAEDWAPLERFALPAGLPVDADRVLAAAGEELRLVTLTKDGKSLREQRYETTGVARGGLVELPVPQSPRTDPFQMVIKVFLVTALAVAVLVTFYKRRSASTSSGGAERPKRDE